MVTQQGAVGVVREPGKSISLSAEQVGGRRLSGVARERMAGVHKLGSGSVVPEGLRLPGTNNAASGSPMAEEEQEAVTVVHPRPQLVRDQWIELNGTWEFAYDDADRGKEGAWYRPGAQVFDREITVPFPPESKASGIGEPGFHPVLWYRRVLLVPAELGDHRLILHFGAVDYGAEVWVNGELAGRHEGGHTPFHFDITTAARAGRELVVVVRAEDLPEDVSQPRGKQAWTLDPRKIWYGRTSGIWQTVWAEIVPEHHVAGLSWEPDLERARVGMELKLSQPPLGLLRAVVSILLAGRLVAEHSSRLYERDSHLDIALPAAENRQGLDELLWSPSSPTLLDVEIELLADDGKTIDLVRSYFGFRSIEVADGRFILNDGPIYLRLALEQGFWPQSHLAAPSSEALQREVELVKELGFNGVRVHQKVEDPRFLYWADRLGILVWSEMPSAYVYSKRALDRTVREWLEVLERDRSHPSIVAWVPINESWGVDHIANRQDQSHFASSLYHLTKAVDPTRPVISNDGWEHVESDVWTIHDYSPTGQGILDRYGGEKELQHSLAGRPWYRRVLLDGTKDQRQPVVLSEIGGFTDAPVPGATWFGHSTVTSPAQLAERLQDLIGAVCDITEIAGYCYTQLTDTAQERNGLLDEYRQPKLPLALLREIFSRVSKAVPIEEIRYRPTDNLIDTAEECPRPAPQEPPQKHALGLGAEPSRQNL
jgi:hypothetical protein